MLFPATFTRYVGTVPPGRTALGGDSVPTGQVPAGTDNLITAKSASVGGIPVQRVAVTYQGPAGAPSLTARMYLYESGTGAWYQLDAQQTLVPGEVGYFNAVTTAEPPVTRANLSGGEVGSGGLYQLLVVDAAMGAPSGAYRFTMAPTMVIPTEGGTSGPVTAAEVSYDDTLNLPPLGAANVQEAIDELKTNTVGGATEAPFTYATGSPFLIQAVRPGQIITRATLVLTQSFDDPSTTIELGTTLNPALIFAPDDVNVDVTTQYDNVGIVVFPSPDFLILTITPRSSTRGTGVIYYWIQDA